MGELKHYGKLGMKWGKITAKITSNETAFRDRLTKLENIKAIKGGSSDYARFKYRNQDLSVRVAKTAKSLVAQLIVKEAISTFIFGKQPDLSKAGITKQVLSLAKSTAIQVAYQDALAKSASNRYNKAATRLIKGSNKNARLNFTREDGIDLGVKTATKMVPYIQGIARMKLTAAVKKRRENEAIFDKWGANILPQKVDNVVWQSADLKTAVIDNR